MKNAVRLVVLVAFVMGAVATSTVAGETVSPGDLDRFAQVNNGCPTFSWGADDGAEAHELVAYVLPDGGPEAVELTADREVLYARVSGRATSWTPSAEQCFAPGGQYVWFVRAVQQFAGDQVIEAGEWSAGRYFEVPAGPSAEEVARAVEVLRQWEAAQGHGSPTLSIAAASVPVAASDSRSRSARRAKSVPTASAAIRGEHPAMSGETYGVVGTSASADGAGVAAANLDRGPDLVLDGSADAEIDALLHEWGIDRPSPVNETYLFTNSGAGLMDVSVDGKLTATAFDCPDCIGSSEIANGAVNRRQIAAGAVTTDAIADEAVTPSKIADGSVGSSKIRSSAVFHSHLADDAVTAAKIADDAVTAAEIADGAVTSAKLAPGAVDTNQIRNGAVSSEKIEDGTVDQADLAFGAVGKNQLQSNAVNTSKILDGTITGADLALSSIDGDHLVAGSVESMHIVFGSIVHQHLADDSVGGENIVNSSIGIADLGPNSVGSSAIKSSAVGSDEIENGSITAADVDPMGGIYVEKQFLDEVSVTETIPAGSCQIVSASCNDFNDLPLAGGFDTSADHIRVTRFEPALWNGAQVSQVVAKGCNEGGTAADLEVTIICIVKP
jgi:hypothetical protein